MVSDKSVEWTGLGKWLSFLAAGLLIVLAIPMVFSQASGAAAGWNIFLGLLLFGVIGSRNNRAPTVATVIAAFMALRLLIAIGLGAAYLDLGISAVLAVIIGLAAWDLRKQRKFLGT